MLHPTSADVSQHPVQAVPFPSVQSVNARAMSWRIFPSTKHLNKKFGCSHLWASKLSQLS